MNRNHTEYDCPLTLISCPYEKMGCETKVQRVQVDSHLQSATRFHLDLACVKLTNTEVKLNKTEAKLNDTDAKLNDAHIKLNETQVKLNETGWKLEATRKVVEKLESRIFIWRINNFSVAVRQAKIRGKISKESVPFYTDRTESYGYKLKVRIYPNDDWFFSHRLSVFIVVMKGEYDAILPWPFKMKLKFTLIDQQEDPVERQNITGLLIPDNKPKAFARPVKEENEECGCAISHKTLYSRRYLVDDVLFIQVEVSPP